MAEPVQLSEREEAFISDLVKIVPEESRFNLEVLLRTHFRMGRTSQDPPELIGVDEVALRSYLRTASQSSELLGESLMGIEPKDIFETALLMGIAVGVHLERERNG
jgi:hypothetical protein